MADKIWSRTVRDQILSAKFVSKKWPHFWAPKGTPFLINNESMNRFLRMRVLQKPGCVQLETRVWEAACRREQLKRSSASASPQRAGRSCRSPSGVVRQVLQCFLSLAHSTGPCRRLCSSLVLLCRPFLWQPNAACRRLCRCAHALLRQVCRPSCSFSMLSAVASFDTGWSVCQAARGVSVLFACS